MTLIGRPWKYDKTVTLKPGEDIPAEWEARTLYLCKYADGTPKRIFFLCPCGCDDRVSIAARNEAHPVDRPSWIVTENADGTTSLSPSVNTTVGCKAHFTITNGDVVWSR